MDYFQQRYYRLLETMLTIIGQWPHQSRFHYWAFAFFAVTLGFSVFVPIAIATVKHRDDVVLVLESGLACNVATVIVLKGAFCKLNERKLFNRINIDWQMWALDDEIQILHEYANQGRKMLLRYMGLMYLLAIGYMLQPAILKMMDVLLNNGSTPGEFPVPIDYHFFDEQKYYFYIIAHIFMTVSVGLLMALSFDCVLIITAYHGCGIFAALGRKLNAVGENERISEGEDKYVARCVKIHNGAIEFADLIESTFTWLFFVTMGFNVFLISCCGYQIVKGTNNLGETARFVASIVATVLPMGVENYMGQILMDHSVGILYSIQSSKWYEQTLKVRYLLYFIMMRCTKSCELTAGKISTMGIELLLAVLKTALSCLTVLRSI